MKKNVVKEYIVSHNGVHLLMHLIRKGNYLIPTVVKVVNNEQVNQKRNRQCGALRPTVIFFLFIETFSFG